VQILNRAETAAEHLARYAQMDIALDTFPYGGTTTTCDALWMGVPVVTLAGNTHASRVGASLLNAMELGDLVATDIAQYVDHAVALAMDHARRAALRESLRQRMAVSPLADGPAFAAQFAAALREMWRRWCMDRAPSATVGGK
jgi:predicted O-linked N-acetylglucosamine transferase (SPINDLY family)